MPSAGCELCDTTGGTLLWQGELCRAVQVAMPAYAGLCRVIWNAHVKEMTDLRAADRATENVNFARRARTIRRAVIQFTGSLRRTS
jgi:diadenosine tetraphosphate (Ap4A) HIT family hydrolase